MKKRNFILISSILCVILTVSLVAYTLVGVFKKPVTEQPATDAPITDTTTNPGDLTSDELLLNFIVGDSYTGSVLTKENYPGALLVANASGVLIATNSGSETVSVQNGGYVYSVTINVYEKGNGTQENPYNIIRATDLIELVKTTYGEYTYYAQRCDLDLSNFDSWVSIGTLTSPFFGSYDGGNYAIKNMNIKVTPENAEDYIDNAQTAGGTNGTMLTVGFFGFVGNPNGEAESSITNLNIHSAKIDTTAIETEEQLVAINLTQSYVGVLAGYVAHTTVAGGLVTADINSSLYCDDTNSTRGAVSAFIGGAVRSNLSGYTVRANISAINPGTVTENGEGYTYNGTTVAGILGRNNTTNISNFDVTISVKARNYENMVISGGVGYIVKPTNPSETTIENININNLYVNVSTYSYTSTKSAIVAGVVGANFDEGTTIKNVTLNNAIINAIGTAQVSGIIDRNDGKVINPTVTGLLKGSYVYGIANINNGEIGWTDDYKTIYAVDATLRGQVEAAGIAGQNRGTIIGASNLTQIKAVISWSVVRKDFAKIAGSAVIAGVAIANWGTIENLHTTTNLVDVVNAGGVVGTMYGGTLKNIDVNTTIRTIAGKIDVETYSGRSDRIGGVVAVVAKGANVTLADIRGNITVNNTAVIDTNNLYGLNYYGTVVGYQSGDVKMTSSDASYKIQATVFTNYTGAEKQYVGHVVGYTKEGNIELDENVKIVIAIEKTADGAVVGDVNK